MRRETTRTASGARGSAPRAAAFASPRPTAFAPRFCAAYKRTTTRREPPRRVPRARRLRARQRTYKRTPARNRFAASLARAKRCTARDAARKPPRCCPRAPIDNCQLTIVNSQSEQKCIKNTPKMAKNDRLGTVFSAKFVNP